MVFANKKKLVSNEFNNFLLGESGDITPISGGSEVEFNTNDATAGSTADYDETVTEEIDNYITMTYDEIFDNKEQGLAQGPSRSTSDIGICSENNLFYQTPLTPKTVTPSKENVNICSNILPNTATRHVENIEKKVFINRIYNEFDDKVKMNKDKNEQRKPSIYDKDMPSCSKNISGLGSDKWSTDKEKFLDFAKNIDFSKSQYSEKNLDVLKNLNIALGKTKVEKEANQLNPNQVKPGAVVIKEKYIEPPRMTRISRSFHGKSPTSNSLLDIATTPRRASDGIPLTSRNLNVRPETPKT